MRSGLGFTLVSVSSTSSQCPTGLWTQEVDGGKALYSPVPFPSPLLLPHHDPHSLQASRPQLGKGTHVL